MNPSIALNAAPASALALEFPSSNHSKRPSFGKTRASCDRCHAQKLRCVSDGGRSKCQRCLRLNTLCQFSPRVARSSQRIRGKATSLSHGHKVDQTSGPQTAELKLATSHATDCGSLFLPNTKQSVMYPGYEDLGQTFFSTAKNMIWPADFGLPEILDLNSIGTFASLDSTAFDVGGSSVFPLDMPSHSMGLEGHNSSDKRGISSSVLRELSTLNIKIYDCSAKLPFAYMAEQTTQSSRAKAYFVFDELFRLTADFIDMLRSLSTPIGGTHTERSIYPETLVSHSLSTSDSSNEVPSRIDGQLKSISISSRKRPFMQVDEVTMFMIVSCYSQLTEMFMSIFDKIEACIKYSRVPQTGNGWAIILPQMQVGAVTLPQLQVDGQTPISSKATSMMYTTMIALLLSHLWEQLMNAVKAGGENCAEVVPGFRFSMVELMWDVVMEKSARLIRSIDKVKGLLHQ